jgi:hypothetical protein
MSSKLKGFVASSTEAKGIARALQLELTDVANVVVWDQAFMLGETTIDGILRNLGTAEFGVFVFAADDTVKIRNTESAAVRDNVILELGMFVGRLGRERSFIVRPGGVDLRLPTDLLGVVSAEYDPEWARKEPRPAVGPASTQIKEALAARRTVANERLNELVRTALEAMCRAMSIPGGPHDATLRAFVFRKETTNEGDYLVCRHYWDPDPSDEEVGRTRFKIDKETAARVIVVKCYNEGTTSRSPETESEGGEVKPLPADFRGAEGGIKPGLRYVLAAPIRNDDDTVWGVVDFDASHDIGIKLLKADYSKTVIFSLAQHLRSVLL